MIIVDRLLEQRQAEGRPIRVGLVGAGFMAKGVLNQIANSTPGMEVVAVVNRTVERCSEIYGEAGIQEPKRVDSADELTRLIESGGHGYTDDPAVLTRCGLIDCLVELTGAVHYAAELILDAIDHGQHVVMMNAELDGTVGPILKTYADRAGVILTASEGDQPGVQMNLFRFVAGMGLRPLVIGNVKGLQDKYRNPTTQEGFARRWGQNVYMVTSFADGTKISFEQAVVANAVGFSVARRGMLGLHHDGHVDELTEVYDYDQLLEWGGIVDYVVGAQPGPAVFILAERGDPKQRHYLSLYKLGEGPLYSFYMPYHLCHFEVPSSVARAVLLNDPVIQPLAGPTVDVVATAKRDLEAGHALDGLGGYDTYGLAENYPTSRSENLLPIGLAEGCKLSRGVRKDAALTYDDVEVPEGRIGDRLRREQDERWK